MIQAIAADSTITAYAAVRPSLLAPARVAFADTGAGKTPVALQIRLGWYFDVLGIPIVRGRAFTAAERDDHPVAIVSESVARALWPHGGGVGETFRLEEDLTAADAAREMTRRCRRAWSRWSASRGTCRASASPTSRKPGIFVPTSVDAPKTSVVARVNGDPDLARQALLDHLTRIDPNMGDDRDHADRRETRDVPPADRLLGVARCSAGSPCC